MTTAREYFREVERASRTAADAERALAALDEVVLGGAGGKGPRPSGVAGDPTFSAYVKAVEERDRLQARRDAALIVIGEALQIVEGLRRLFSRKADVVEMHYIDCMEWSAVANEMGVGESTVYKWCSEVFVWVDSHPMAYVLGLRSCGD